jgi:hypothetical protein
MAPKSAPPGEGGERKAVLDIGRKKAQDAQRPIQDGFSLCFLCLFAAKIPAKRL